MDKKTIMITGAAGFVGYRGTATDLTRELDAERRALFLTRHDALTDLPNRCLLGERLGGGPAHKPAHKEDETSD